MQPISILLVITSYPPIIGGSEIEAQRVSEALIRRGHRVQVVCPGGAPMPQGRQWTDERGIPVRLVGGSLPARLRGHVFAWTVAWMIFMDRRRYDLVYFLMPGLQVALGGVAAKLARRPFVMKFSGSNEILRLARFRIGRAQLRVVDAGASAIMILNPGMRREAAECGLRASKLVWMPNPVDTGEFLPADEESRRSLRARLEIEPRAKVVLFVGRLAPEKELATLIAAFTLILERHPDAILVLAGDGVCREELQRTVCAGAEGRIRFTGALAPSSVREWLQASDLFALVSSLEGFPVSLIEAMATGLPSVVSDIPAIRQLVSPDVEGVLAEVKNAPATAVALDRMLGDRALRRRMGAAARDRVSRDFSTPHVIDLYERIFASVLHREGSGKESVQEA